MDVSIEDIRASLKAHKQEQLLKFEDKLSEEEKKSLLAEIKSIDFGRLLSSFEESRLLSESSSEKKDARLKPLSPDICGSTLKDQEKVAGWEARGLRAIGESKVAVLLLAGGQGTRLGVPYPKGMYNVGLPSGKTLYQLQAERILKLEQLAAGETGASCTIPWYIMTSEHTKGNTVKFFESHDYFGLDRENVVVFEQSTLPCVDFEGKVILSTKNSVARAPDGNGGLYGALDRRGVLEDMEKRGAEYIHVYCVDNILVKMADPVFMGFCLEKGAECGAKVVHKAFETEAVGVVCLCDGKYQVVEYSEISIETAKKRNKDGVLTFNAGNIANHFFTRGFLQRIVSDHIDNLKHHIARKKIPYVNEQGQQIKPDKPNGIKMEKFVFDVFEFAKSFAVLEVKREDEFSPLKNAPGTGKDSPETAKSSLLDLHYRQVLSAGGRFLDEEGRHLPAIPGKVGSSSNPGSPSVRPLIECEISPLVSYFGEGLKEHVAGKCFTSPVQFRMSNSKVEILQSGIENGSPQAKKLKPQ
jgi:UDP-N-acetylglucosamine/UDP-N-acetylgalactosamine diphosphorylase